ncbi:hypothetical protein PR202_ga12764 [Eleusine coracana subsp. coracana]|uniref:CRC domain-containing protein n=1 Tax=Eleusine coracana subsp. coracana TaxID=191504 RepID=A0AAV5CCZ0_ELECO|nr:hypothetical protein PR202_ga12764 [Eleusine coracana subsp. coracana]
MGMQSVLNVHPANICTGNYLNLVGSPACTLPGVGLHLNAVASIPKEIMPYNNQASGDPYNIVPFADNLPLLPGHNSPMRSVFSGNELIPHSCEVDTYIQSDHSSQKTMPRANGSIKESHNKRSISYCACFAAKVYCSESCSCQGCSNNHSHEEVVLCIRKQIESRNPLAFAPNIIRTCGSSQEFGVRAGPFICTLVTPSSWLIVFFSCYRTTLTKLLLRLDIKEAATAESLLVLKNTASAFSLFLRASVLLPSTCSRLPFSSVGCSSAQHNSQALRKADALLSHFSTYGAELILANGPSDSKEGNSYCTAGVKVVSPNKKRVSPLHIGPSLSPINRSARKLVLKSFPSLSSDENSEPH